MILFIIFTKNFQKNEKNFHNVYNSNMANKSPITRPIISSALKKLTNSEELVIKYINQYQKQIFDLTQKELAKASFSSEPTISRLLKKLGYKSYKEFVYKINYQLMELNRKYPIYREKNVVSVAKNIVNSHMYSAANSIDRQIISQLENLAKTIHDKRKIIIWGLGASNKIAQEITVNLQRIGIIAYCPYDFHVLLPIIGSFTEKDLVIFLSDSGNNKEILFCINEAKKLNIKTILITNNTKPLIAPNILISYKRIVNEGFLTPVASKTTQSVICDILFQLVVATNIKYKKQIMKSMDLINLWRKTRE